MKKILGAIATLFFVSMPLQANQNNQNILYIPSEEAVIEEFVKQQAVQHNLMFFKKAQPKSYEETEACEHNPSLVCL